MKLDKNETLRLDMRPLPPEELAKYAQQFRTEAKILAQGQYVAQVLRLGLTRLGERKDLIAEHPDVWEALAEGVIHNLERYAVGEDLPLLAWTTRNIFELETILAFITASPENLKSFVNDVILDEIQVREASFVLNFDRTDPEVTLRQNEALDRLRNCKAELALKRNRPMFTSEMARAISPERGKEYQSFNKLYSKAVHPTAYLLIGGKLESTNWEAYRLHVMLHGIWTAGEFCSRWFKELYGEESGVTCDG